VGAEGLYKRDLFGSPDPFAVITVDSSQTHTTQVAKKTLTPYWGEEMELSAFHSTSLLMKPKKKKKNEKF